MKVCFDCRRCYDDSEVYCTEESHRPLSQIRDGSPEIIPGYRSDLLLGSDMKGETFSAYNAGGSPCLITIRSVDEGQSRQLLREAELAAAFCHPNVVDVYEAGRLETGEVFVVSEDPEGTALRKLLETDSVPEILTTVQVVRQTAEALYALHTSGLTHGAISPQNIILTSNAQNRLLVRIKDLDLGGVISSSVISNKFHSDSALDSLRYFAPEQCSGNGTSPPADIYSLGIVLHEMLAGAPPFNASKAVGLMEQHRNQPPPEIRIDSFDLRMLLTHTLTEALRKQPEMRQASANVFARQMRHMEQLATHSSVPPPAMVVPAVQPKHEGVISVPARPVRSANTPPAAVMEKAPDEEKRQLAATIVEPATASVTMNEIEPTSSIAADPVHVLPEILHHAVEEPIVQYAVMHEQKVAPERPRRSRLKALKRKLRSGAAHIPEIPESSVEDLPEPLHHAIEEPVDESIVAHEETAAPTGPRRSRLRVLKRKLRSMTPHVLLAIQSPPIEETFLQPEAPPTELRVVQAVETAAAPAAFARVMPKVVQWEQPEDDIPSEADILEALSQEAFPDPFLSPEPQDVTYVPAYNRLTVDLETPEVPRFLPEGQLKTFVPQKVVLLSSVNIASPMRETVDADQSGPIFSSFYGQSSRHHLWKMAGGGIVMLAALAFVGRLAVRDFVLTDTQSEPPASTTVQTSPPQSVQPVAASPASPIPAKNVKSSTPQASDVTLSKPPPSKDLQPPSAERSRTPAVETGSKKRTPYTALVGRNLGPTPPATSTVVITYGNGKVTSRTEPARGSAAKKPVAAPKRSTDVLRPRIVRTPN